MSSTKIKYGTFSFCWQNTSNNNLFGESSKSQDLNSKTGVVKMTHESWTTIPIFIAVSQFLTEY